LYHSRIYILTNDNALTKSLKGDALSSLVCAVARA